jgi:capsular polysaccharide biosynthesis protein
MELNEAFRRILGQHWRLILVALVLGAGVAVAIHRDDADEYLATTRFVIDAEDPTSQTESAAVADTAKAIATSPAQVAHALKQIDAGGRDPAELGKEHISLRPLGTSGVLQISVVDRNAEVAAALADELARGVIAKRLDIRRGHLHDTVQRLETRIEQLTDRIAELRSAGGASLAEADLLVQRRSILETQHLNLLATDALASRPSIVSSATVPREAESSGFLPDLVLGMLLGLIVGVGVAGLLETLWPTLSGGEAIARELQTPLLGALSGGPYQPLVREEAGRVATRLRLAAKAAGVRGVGLLGVAEDLDAEGLAALLDAVPDPLPGELGADAPAGEGVLADAGAPTSTVVAPARRACRIRAYDLDRATEATNGNVSGLVLVSPAAVKKTDVAAVEHLLRVSPSPLLGLVTYAGSWRRLRSILRFTGKKGARDGN